MPQFLMGIEQFLVASIMALAKKDAQFLYEGKEISSNRAIKLLKNNKNLDIDSRASKGKRPVVKISASPIEIE